MHKPRDLAPKHSPGRNDPPDEAMLRRPCCDEGEDLFVRVRLRQTISCKPADKPGDPIGFIILAGRMGSLRRVVRSDRETTDWEGARLLDRESDNGIGHVELDTALVWHMPKDLPPPDPDNLHPCNFDVFETAEIEGGLHMVNVPLELLKSE